MTQFEKLTLLLGLPFPPGDEAKLLTLLLDEARNFILSYTRRSAGQWDAFFDSLQIKIAVVEYNRLGAEGIAGRLEGQISTTFLPGGDYPASILKPLDGYRLIKGVVNNETAAP